MIKDIIFRFLSREPRTLEDLSEETGVPRSVMRSALTTEMFLERKFNHPEIGTVTNWVPNPNSRVRVDNNGIYHLIDR